MPKGDEINFGKVSFHSHPIRWDNERPDDGQSNYKEHLRNGPGWECQSPKMKVDTSWFQWTFHNIIEVKFNFRNLCVGSLLGSSSSSSAGCQGEPCTGSFQAKERHNERRLKRAPNLQNKSYRVQLHHSLVQSIGRGPAEVLQTVKMRFVYGWTKYCCSRYTYYVTRLMNGWMGSRRQKKKLLYSALLCCPSVIHLSSPRPCPHSPPDVTLWSGFVQNELNEKCRLFSSLLLPLPPPRHHLHKWIKGNAAATTTATA